MPSALDGVTVVDITRGMAGALAAMFLCDNGARVIRVEDASDPEHPRPEGYRIWNRGKESLALDLSEAVQGTRRRRVARVDGLRQAGPQGGRPP